MVDDGIHILLGVALVALLIRPDRVEPYLVVVLAASLPDLDRYLFAPFVYTGYLSGPLWTHRGITHSVVALVLVVGTAYAVGLEAPAALGYGSHLAADFLTGGVRLLASLSTAQYGLYYDWVIGNVVAGTVAGLVIVAELAVRLRRDDETRDAGIDPENGARALVGRVRRWFQ